MSMQRTLAELTKECSKLSIPIPTSIPGNRGSKVGRKDLVNLLAQHHLSKMEHVSWGLKMRMQIESPMVCFAFWNLRGEEKAAWMDGTGSIAEEKFDGARLICCYHPDEGFTFFSRNLSVEDYLPVDYTDKILLIKDGVVRRPEDFKGTFKKPFILDQEAMCSGNIDTTGLTAKGGRTETELNATSAILSINQLASHTIQIEQSALVFHTFDFLYFEDRWMTNLPLIQRKAWLTKMMDVLVKHTPFKAVHWQDHDKQQFFDDIVARGGEGIILKAKDKAYLANDSRPRTHQIKRKRSVGESTGADVDAFVSGFVKSDPAKGWAHLIGAIQLSIFLRDPDGSEKEHWLASVSSMPLEMRQAMTITGPDGKPDLNPLYLDKVLTINGQDVSGKALRFMHATADWRRGFRDDKSKHECIMATEVLKSMVL